MKETGQKSHEMPMAEQSDEKPAGDSSEHFPSVVDIQEETHESAPQTKSTFPRIFTYSDRPDWILNTFATVAAIASGVLLALVNVVFGGFVKVVNDFTRGGSPSKFRSDSGRYALYFVFLAIARFCFAYTYTTCSNIAASRISSKIRQSYLKSTLSQHVGFFDEESRSSVSSQITNNGNLVQQGIGEKLCLCIQAISAFIASFVVSFIAQWKLTLITAWIVPVIAIIVGIASSIDAKYETEMLNIYGQADAHAEDVISSMRTVHAFSAGPRLVDNFLFSTEFFLVYAGYALAFWRGVHMFNNGEISSPGTIVTVLFSVVVAATSMTQIAPHILTFTKAASAASTLFKTIDEKSKINPFDDKGMIPGKVVGELELSNVNFSYPSRPDIPVLTDFRLKVPAGKVTALVGASGSGKSTIVGLLERWYDPISGSIKLDGHSTKDLNLRWLRGQLGLVGQEPVLFIGTVFENVAYGLGGTKSEDAPVDEKRRLVKEACKISNAHDFICALPDGYDTQCGERGGMLSGGQKQRVAIARSIVSEPPILLLDEATSALDPQAEIVVQEALNRAAKHRTTIFIAHKLSTIKNADSIAVISKGHVVEQGTHNSLLEADGIYAKLVSIQDLGSASVDDSKDEPVSKDELTKPSTQVSTHISHLEAQKNKENFECSKKIGTLQVVWTLLKEQKNLKWCYFLSTITCLVGGATYPGQALLFSKEMNVFLLPSDRLIDRGNFFSLMFFVVALGNLLVFSTAGWISNTIVQTIGRHYRKQLFQSILKQDMQFFDRPENTAGALTSHLSSNPQSITELMGFNLMIILISVVNLAASCILAISYGWKLGLVVIFAGLPPLVASGYIRIRLDLKMNNSNAARYETSAAFAGEAFAAIRTVSSLGIEPTILSRFEAQLEDVNRSTIKQTMHMMVYFSLTQTIEFLFLALGFWYGCRLISFGEYTMSQFYIVFLAVFFSGQSASQIFGWSSSITKAKAGANYIFWLRNLQPLIFGTDNRHWGSDGETPLCHLEMENVRFSYPLRSDIPILRGISITLEPDSHIALVGASGCGKSTIIALLERFYDPTNGKICLSSQDIKHISPLTYRSFVSLVQQEPTLYQLSIRENIALGLPSYSLEESKKESRIEKARKQANIHTFIQSLPQGLDTPCGSKGVSLSGGQRQRIAIARALIRNPRILLLDEATSALDSQSEQFVLEALRNAVHRNSTSMDEKGTEEKETQTEPNDTGGRITISVAHRLSTIRDADSIFVFSGGKIVEAGGHKELLAKGGMYSRMCRAQMLDRSV